MIIFPSGTEINVQFGSCVGGEIYFVYCGHSLGVFQLVFFPRLFSEKERVLEFMNRELDSWHMKGSQPLVNFTNVRAANIYSIPFGRLVQFSELEFKLVGIKIEMVSISQRLASGTSLRLLKPVPHTQKKGR